MAEFENRRTVRNPLVAPFWHRRGEVLALVDGVPPRYAAITRAEAEELQRDLLSDLHGWAISDSRRRAVERSLAHLAAAIAAALAWEGGPEGRDPP